MMIGEMRTKLRDRFSKLIEQNMNLNELFTNLTYDEYVDLIVIYHDDPDMLSSLATGISLNPNLTETQKEILYDMIDEEIERRG